MLYEHLKHDGSLPIIGVNTFRSPGPMRRYPRSHRAGPRDQPREALPARPGRRTSGPDADEAEAAITRLKEAATSGDNVFAVLMDAARVCSLGQVTEAFFEVGGQYRRNV